MNGSRDMAVTIVSAVVGAIAGYLLFTDAGRTMRRQMAPALQRCSQDITDLQRAVRGAVQAAHEGWTMLSDALGGDNVALGDSSGAAAARFGGRPRVR